MNDAVQEKQMRKNNFFRDQYRRMLKFAILLAGLAVIQTVLLSYMTLSPAQPDYYATTTAGVVTPLHPLSQPVVTNQYLLQWSSTAVQSALNFDYVHYQDQFNQTKPYFTPGGWSKYQAAMQSSGLLDAVQKQKLVMSAVVSGPPVILNSYTTGGRFTWRVQLPVLVTFESASQKTQEALVITMNVQRVPVLDTIAGQGIQITDFVAATKVT